MYAIVETGGEQLRVSQGDIVKINRKMDSDTKQIDIDKVLLLSKDDTVYIGAPYLDKASVTAEVRASGKSAKVLVFKQKPRKGHRKLRGHSQDYTLVEIKDIVFGG
jgi:large subunit ribosomal protein L21